MSRKNANHYRQTFRVVVILLFAVCIIGLLILPQVDPDNFVLNSTKPINALMMHAQTALISPLFTLFVLDSVVTPTSRFWSSSSRHVPSETGVFVVLTAVLLRC
jgi:hypothetical protein